uniref:Uncharacterized protein n=1 Tax=Oryza sativa subsp. japonica TaxID=39947 RepID=Q6ERI7_ORYSJ|nr:hypothetical protein [Oryza sativa Japonica Group]BAD28733.1 hypothetical protein [Oryza sativa Japonica Group]
MAAATTITAARQLLPAAAASASAIGVGAHVAAPPPPTPACAPLCRPPASGFVPHRLRPPATAGATAPPPVPVKKTGERKRGGEGMGKKDANTWGPCGSHAESAHIE